MFVESSKVVVFPQHKGFLKSLAVLENPILSVFGSELITYLHNIITLFHSLESDASTHGFNKLHVIPLMDALGIAFDPDYTVFSTSPLKTTWTGDNANLNIPLAHRAYRYGDLDKSPIYFKVEVGARGVADTNASRAWGRPYVKLYFATTDSFETLVNTIDLSIVSNSNLYPSPICPAFTTKMAYFFNENALAIYPFAHYAHTIPASVIGRSSGYSISNNMMSGLLLSEGVEYSALTPERPVNFAIVSPGYLGTSGASDGRLAHGCLGTNINRPANLITSEFTGFLSAAAPQAGNQSINDTPPRDFSAPFVYTATNGAVITSNNVIWMADKFKDRIDYADTSVYFGGEDVGVKILPNLITHSAINADWYANLGGFCLGMPK